MEVTKFVGLVGSLPHGSAVTNACGGTSGQVGLKSYAPCQHGRPLGYGDIEIEGDEAQQAIG